MRVVQAVVSQAVCVAETLQDTVHETLGGKKKKKHGQVDSPTDGIISSFRVCRVVTTQKLERNE